MIRQAIGVWGMVVGVAALWTGVQGGFRTCSMVGFLPPHYGYSAYAVVPLLSLANPAWLRSAAVVTLLLSGNRASWVGGIAGWAWAGGRRRIALAAALALTAVVAGNALKPRGAVGDSVRVHVWKAAIRQSVKAPGEFCIGVDGYAVTKAHSDVLQVAAEHGWKAAALVVLVLGWAFLRLPEGPEKAVVAALSVQSLIDNRLTVSWACAALYAASWICAARSGRQP